MLSLQERVDSSEAAPQPLSLQDRVDNGIRFLDADLGPGWEHRISLGRLDISSCAHCICGQLYSDRFGEGLGYMRMMQGDGARSWELGFAGSDITPVWKDAIQSLIRADRVSKTKQAQEVCV